MSIVCGSYFKVKGIDEEEYIIPTARELPGEFKEALQEIEQR